jgi:hypothetical protein
MAKIYVNVNFISLLLKFNALSIFFLKLEFKKNNENGLLHQN